MKKRQYLSFFLVLGYFLGTNLNAAERADHQKMQKGFTFLFGNQYSGRKNSNSGVDLAAHETLNPTSSQDFHQLKNTSGLTKKTKGVASVENSNPNRTPSVNCNQDHGWVKWQEQKEEDDDEYEASFAERSANFVRKCPPQKQEKSLDQLSNQELLTDGDPYGFFNSTLQDCFIDFPQKPAATLSSDETQEELVAQFKQLSGAFGRKVPDKPNLLLSEEDLEKFLERLDEFARVVEARIAHGTLCPATVDYNRFTVQRKVVEKGTTVLFVGDLHGRIDVLNAILKDWNVKGLLDDNMKLRADCLVVFLGDYVDRGLDGFEVIRRLMELYLANAAPGNVVLLRGNHEDQNQNIDGGFGKELKQKCVDAVQHVFDKICINFYEKLPVALYLGDQWGHFIRCNHGGDHPAYNPYSLIYASMHIEYDSLYNGQSYFQRGDILPILVRGVRDEFAAIKLLMGATLWKVPGQNDGLAKNGFLWADYALNKKQETFYDQQCGRISYSYTNAQELLKKCELKGVIRAHQHVEMLNLLEKYNGFFALGECNNTEDPMIFTQGMIGTCYPCLEKAFLFNRAHYVKLSIKGSFNDGKWVLEKETINTQN